METPPSSNTTPKPAANGANGAPRPAMRRPKPADPLVRPKKKVPRPPGAALAPPSAPIANAMKQGIEERGDLSGYIVPPKDSTPGYTGVSGFSSEPLAEYKDYPVYILPDALDTELRFHVARFTSKGNVDVRDEATFPRPVRLQRRDPRQPWHEQATRAPEEVPVIDPAVQEEQERIKAEKAAQKAADMAQIAPAHETIVQKKKQTAKTKVQQVFRFENTDAQKEKSKIRYEEAMPWHLDDFDHKQLWVGTYEQALSEKHALMFFHNDAYYIAPVEKWYKFQQKTQFRGLGLEEAEAKLRAVERDPKRLREMQEMTRQQEEDRKAKKGTSKLFVGKIERQMDTKVNSGIVKREDDVDEIDFEEDFADDEANPLFEGEEDDLKEVEKRIKRDQLQANIFNMKEEKEYENADLKDKLDQQALKLHGRKLRKALKKREKNEVYDSDSDHPYSSQSEEETDDEALKAELAAKLNDPEGTDANGNKIQSGNDSEPSTGANTPSNRQSKHAERKAAAQSLKRPGSPLQSDLSGNESARKRIKSEGGVARKASGLDSRPGSGTATPVKGLEKDRLAVPGQKKGVSKLRTAADVDSGAEMSDGARKRIKIKTSANGSRAASPGGSRNTSPTRPKRPLPTLEEMRDAIGPEGVNLSTLTQTFRGAIEDHNLGAVTEIMKRIATYDKNTRMIQLKAQKAP